MESDLVDWSTVEINRLIELWQKNIAAINRSEGDTAMAEIAKGIGSEKTTQQVAAKIKQMKERYLEERSKTRSKWRFFNKLKHFGTQIVNDNRAQAPKRRVPFNSENQNSPLKTPARPSTDSPVQAKAARYSDSPIETGINRLVAAVNKLGNSSISTEFPPIYPYDAEIAKDVVINDAWREWNQTLPYKLTDGGIRSLIRSGFRDVAQISLLKTKSADISMLHLNYHDKLALEQAIAVDMGKPEKVELVKNDEGAVIGIHGSVDTSDAVLLSDDGLKMLEWNQSLKYSLSLRGLAKILKAGFTNAEELSTLLTDDCIDFIDLTLRDKMILRRFVIKSDGEDKAEDDS